MLNMIATGIGYITIIAFGLALLGFLIWITYIVYDHWLKKMVSWKEVQTRKDIFYFIKHKKEIQEYIKKKKGGLKQ